MIGRKNWREWSYILVMTIPVIYTILIGSAMIFYSGGSLSNPSSKGYSFSTNFLSDLGRTRGYSGKANTISCALFTLNYLLFGILVIPFFIATPHLFIENELQIKLSKIGSLFGIISAFTLIGVALAPWDTQPELHGIFGGIQGFTVPITLILYAIVINRNELYSKQYTFLFVVILSIWIISAIVSLSGVSIYQLEGLMLVVILQKITTFSTIFCLFVHAYGAWKLEMTLN